MYFQVSKYFSQDDIFVTFVLCKDLGAVLSTAVCPAGAKIWSYDRFYAHVAYYQHGRS
jgi:hypothetical protein